MNTTPITFDTLAKIGYINFESEDQIESYAKISLNSNTKLNINSDITDILITLIFNEICAVSLYMAGIPNIFNIIGFALSITLNIRKNIISIVSNIKMHRAKYIIDVYSAPRDNKLVGEHIRIYVTPDGWYDQKYKNIVNNLFTIVDNMYNTKYICYELDEEVI